MQSLEDFLGPKFVFSGVQAPFDQAKVVFLGVPLSTTQSFKQTAKQGPVAIREVSLNIESFDINSGKDAFDNVLCHDAGDIWVTPGNIQETLWRVEQATQIIKAKQKIPFILGGDHCVSIGSFKPFKKDEDVVIVHFDAHPDLKEEYAGDKIAHATALRRMLDDFPPENLLQLGIRSTSKEEQAFIKKNNITSITSTEIKENLAAVAETVKNFTKDKKVYLTVDIDVFDMSLVPATGTPEPDGLEFSHFTKLISSISGTLVGADVVEVGRDANLLTPTMAAKSIFLILCQDIFR